MRGQRVLVSGMGSELGSLVAALLESEPWVGPLEGLDVDPPRRRLRRALFHRLEPGNRAGAVEVITRFNPHVVVDVSVWEPDARVNTATARQFTLESALSVLGAAAECPALQHIVLRSAAEIYGRSRGSLTRPDEDAPIDPTSEFGRMAAKIEAIALDVGNRVGVTVGALRLATVLGPHVPSPLGRLLRLPAVPFSLLADPPFAVVRDLDAAQAFVAAARIGLTHPLNIVGPGAITASQAILRGRRLPIPLLGPGWVVARRISHMAGAPIPDHVVETMHRGRLIDGGRAHEVLGITPGTRTPDVIDSLFAWPSIVRVITPSTAPADEGVA